MPRAWRLLLQVALFLPLFVGYWYVHHRLALWMLWLPEMFSELEWRKAGLLASTVLCGLFAGMLFALPVRWVFPRRSVLAAAVIALLVVLFDLMHLRLSGALTFTKVTFLLDFSALLLALPASVALLRRLWPNQPAR